MEHAIAEAINTAVYKTGAYEINVPFDYDITSVEVGRIARELEALGYKVEVSWKSLDNLIGSNGIKISWTCEDCL